MCWSSRMSSLYPSRNIAVFEPYFAAILCCWEVHWSQAKCTIDIEKEGVDGYVNFFCISFIFMYSEWQSSPIFWYDLLDSQNNICYLRLDIIDSDIYIFFACTKDWMNKYLLLSCFFISVQMQQKYISPLLFCILPLFLSSSLKKHNIILFLAESDLALVLFHSLGMPEYSCILETEELR